MIRIIIFSLLVGCGASKGLDENTKVPDFSLTDTNPTSDRYDTQVSPRDLQEQISGWYFGHAT